MYGNICNRCKSHIPNSRQQETHVICVSCGAVQKESSKAFYSKLKSRVRISSFLGMALICGSLIHSVNWSTDALNVIPLKLKVLADQATSADLQAFSRLCEKHGHIDCMENYLVAATKVNPNSLSAQKELGLLSVKLKKYEQAKEAFRQFYALGGNDLESAHNFARALAKTGEMDLAIQYYEYVLQSKPQIIQVTVLKNFVNDLVEDERFDKAKSVIETTRNRGSNTLGFMEYELSQINSKLKS